MAVRDEIQIGWLFRKLRKQPHLNVMPGRIGLSGKKLEVGWGYRPSGLAAARKSRSGGRPLLLLEDAFVRSMKPGCGQVYGLTADSQGIYYDSQGCSDLIQSLNTGTCVGYFQESSLNAAEVRGLMSRFRASKVSKYNWYPGDFSSRPEPLEPGVMVVDQTKGDASLSHGGVRAEDFDRMVRNALDEHPDKVIYLRAHPDHRYRGKHSCFSPWVFNEPRVKLLPADLSPASCFEFCSEVYAGSSLMGMEALLHGLKVKAYGWNFYAGWGLTEDRCQVSVNQRERKLDLPELFEAAYLRYCHYFDPDSGEPCGLDRILDHLDLQRAVAKENRGTRVTVGWAPWKKELTEDFFKSPGTDLQHARVWDDAVELLGENREGKILMWGATAIPQRSTTVSTIRVEDGFLRSSGLGATFHKPLSWVLDGEGIYFDPRTSSSLESILESADFTPREMEDSRALLQFLREHRLTKYNVGYRDLDWDKGQAGNRKVILVPGQVEADASIKCGSPELKTNAALLERVRKLEPEAYLIFKAHPDLVAKARHGNVVPSVAGHLADLTVTDGNILDWLDRCDEVHTMTSTTGFEAILRNIPVVTHGTPFYAGWGLTRDHLECPRRTRRLTVEELLCGAMIRYPRYLNPRTGEFTTAIQVAGLLSRGSSSVEQRAWYLRLLLILKNGWVALAR